MIRIDCPSCGQRDEIEFVWGGEASRHRPSDPQSLTDREWAEYLYMRTNPEGVDFERWCHLYGCGQWFNLARDTKSHRILAVYRLDQERPQFIQETKQEVIEKTKQQLPVEPQPETPPAEALSTGRQLSNHESRNRPLRNLQLCNKEAAARGGE